MDTFKNNKNILIALVVIIFAAGGFLVYYFFIKPDLNDGLAESGIKKETSRVLDVVSKGLSSPEKGGDMDLLSTLNQLQNIKLENRLEGQPGFAELVDRSVLIEPGDPGRENPFAPISEG